MISDPYDPNHNTCGSYMCFSCEWEDSIERIVSISEILLITILAYSYMIQDQYAERWLRESDSSYFDTHDRLIKKSTMSKDI